MGKLSAAQPPNNVSDENEVLAPPVNLPQKRPHSCVFEDKTDSTNNVKRQNTSPDIAAKFRL